MKGCEPLFGCGRRGGPTMRKRTTIKSSNAGPGRNGQTKRPNSGCNGKTGVSFKHFEKEKEETNAISLRGGGPRNKSLQEFGSVERRHSTTTKGKRENNVTHGKEGRSLDRGKKKKFGRKPRSRFKKRGANITGNFPSTKEQKGGDCRKTDGEG